MSGYPTGAGPYAGAFTGEVWNGSASASGLDVVRNARPLVATQAAELGQLPYDGEVFGAQVVRPLCVFTAPTSASWLVHRITVQAGEVCDVRVFIGHPIWTNIISGTRRGDFATDEPGTPYFVPAGDRLTVAWWPSTETVVCRARIEYREVA